MGEEAISLLQEAINVLSKQEAVVFMNCKSLAVLGDTHGYPEVTEWFLSNPELDADCKVILGDLVDRGPRQVENLELALEAVVDGKVVLLRGNHEDKNMNSYYGFMIDLKRKRSSKYAELVWRVYREIPLAAVASVEGYRLFLVHGGIPCRECSGGPEPPVGLEEIASRASSFKGSPGGEVIRDPLVFQLLWNDPDPYLEWFSPSIRGRGIFYYGTSAWRDFILANELDLLVRAHEAVNGIVVYKPDKSSVDAPVEAFSLESVEAGVVTVFSSLYHGKSSAAIRIEDGVVRPFYYRLVEPGRSRKTPGGKVPI